MRFAGKVFLVTGAGRGIGRAIAKRLVDDGARVCILERDRQAGLDAAREAGERALFVRADIASERDVRRAIGTCVKWGERLDGVVNNAALADPDVGPLEELTLARWQQFVDVNLTGTFLVTKHAVTHVREARGSIINLGSIRAVQSEPNTEPYAACKGAILAFTHALAISLGPSVRVNCISPGWIETDPKKRLSKRDHAQHPVGRVGEPADVANLCAWLLSDEASFVTGQNFVTDGGMSRKMIWA